MTNLLQQAINCDDGYRAARIIQEALGIESDDVANYCFPKTWPRSNGLGGDMPDQGLNVDLAGSTLRADTDTVTISHCRL